MGTSAAIPTASTADIAFLLLIFFLSTTIFRMERGLPVDLPRAESGERLPRQRAVHVYVDALGLISVDDLLIRVQDLEGILARKLAENSTLIVALTFDEAVPYETADRVLEQLKRANALNTSFVVEPEAEGGP